MEMFAGIGGFHHGLQRANSAVRAVTGRTPYQVVWANQWEPARKAQHAAQVYAERTGLEVINRDINEVLKDEAELKRIDDLAPNMLVGGFPCQDYSVANSGAAGLAGAKGSLWWSIHAMLQQRLDAGLPIETVLLENVDRLLASPKGAPGQDFAVILASLQRLGYAVTWQVVNAGDYGYPQRRRRTYILAVHETTSQYQACVAATGQARSWLVQRAPLARAFPVQADGRMTCFAVGGDEQAALQQYRPTSSGRSQFANAGLCVDGKVWTIKTKAMAPVDVSEFVGRPQPLTLGDVVAATGNVPEACFIDDKELARWEQVKGAKSIPRTASTGYQYTFSEGAMPFPDRLDRAARTIITSELGGSASRTRHVIRHSDGRLRRLTAEELEVAFQFPHGYTAGLSDAQRSLLLGNAVMPGVIERIARVVAD
ncbi:MAG: DNA (cytosine-5-)-methyltransferase [Curvibacter sp.]|nr:DNA (cytosine-5-)-methyltransferase [Curvibacter sp.]